MPETPARMDANIRYPVLTYGLVSVLIALFALQLVLGEYEGFLSPTPASLEGLGGLSPALVASPGAWYRLFSSAFLHAGLLHALFNALALLVGGILLESWLGRSWYLAIFAMSILGGGLAGLLLDDPGIVDVGAAGAIMGLLATLFVVTFRLPAGAERASAQVNLLYCLVPVLIPLGTQRIGGEVGFGAYVGGAFTGLVVGTALLRTWPPDQKSPRFGGVAIAAALAGSILMAGSLGLALSKVL